MISEKDEQIQVPNFEFDKYKRNILGKKNENRPGGVHADANQINLFERGTGQHQQDELSERAANLVKEKALIKKRKKVSGE